MVVSTAAFHAGVRGSVAGLGGLRETKRFLPHPRVKLSIVGNLRDREVACSASDRQGSNFESCVWRTVSAHSSHHPQEVLLAQFTLFVHKGGLKPDSFIFLILRQIHVDAVIFKITMFFWRTKLITFLRAHPYNYTQSEKKMVGIRWKRWEGETNWAGAPGAQGSEWIGSLDDAIFRHVP